MYFPAANAVALTVGGVEAVRYTGASAPLIRYGITAGITADVVQTQGSGQLTSSYNEVSVCANNDDTVTLPTCLKGEFCIIINNGTKRLQIFPATGQDIGQGLNQPDSVKAGASIFFMSFSNTAWFDIATKVKGLLDTDVVGISANDLLYFDGTNYSDTNGDLTWDGSIFTGINLKATKYIQNRTATTAQLADITHAVNTDAGKIQGSVVYNTTTDNPVWAVGNADGSIWVNGIGTTVHTPV